MTWILDRGRTVPSWRPAVADPACVLAFSTRQGGVSEPPWDTLDLGRSSGDRPEAVEENRRRFLGHLGLDPARLATADQVHGTSARLASGPGAHPDCDALVSLTPGLALAVATADCMCLLFAAPGAVAAVHAGWRGAAAGIVTAAFRAFRHASGAAPDAVRVVLGPCIRSCCYEVGPEVARLFPAAAVRETPSHPRLDLPAVARLQLLEAGLPPGAFTDTHGCTACEPALYFSHRRDAGRTGRLWGVAALRAPDRGVSPHGIGATV